MNKLLDWLIRKLTEVKYEEICPVCLKVATVEFSGYVGDEVQQIKDAISENIHVFCLGLVESSVKDEEER